MIPCRNQYDNKAQVLTRLILAMQRGKVCKLRNYSNQLLCLYLHAWEGSEMMFDNINDDVETIREDCRWGNNQGLWTVMRIPGICTIGRCEM